MNENYCGSEEAFKAIGYYRGIGCPSIISSTSIPNDFTFTKEESTSKIIRQQHPTNYPNTLSVEGNLQETRSSLESYDSFKSTKNNKNNYNDDYNMKPFDLTSKKVLSFNNAGVSVFRSFLDRNSFYWVIIINVHLLLNYYLTNKVVFFKLLML